MSRADDIEAIRRLTHVFFWGWDTGDVDAATNVFTQDGINDESRVGSYVVRGHVALRQNFEALQPSFTHAFHVVGNHIIDFDDEDHAHGTSSFDGSGVLVDGRVARARHYFFDTYVRQADGWRIKTRTAHPLTPDEPPRTLTK